MNLRNFFAELKRRNVYKVASEEINLEARKPGRRTGE